jgi:hypothetical protein
MTETYACNVIVHSMVDSRECMVTAVRRKHFRWIKKVAQKYVTHESFTECVVTEVGRKHLRSIKKLAQNNCNPRVCQGKYVFFVCFLLGISPASDEFLPTCLNPLAGPSSKAGSSLWRWTCQRVQTRRQKFIWRRGNTQKKTYKKNILSLTDTWVTIVLC